MKRDFRRLVALGALLVGLVIAGCKHEPSPPTEADAIAVWKTCERSSKPLANRSWSALNKTNGQMQTCERSKSLHALLHGDRKTP